MVTRIGLPAALLLVSFLISAPGCGPNAMEQAAIREEMERLKSSNDDLTVKYNRAIQEILRLQGQVNAKGNGDAQPDRASLEAEVKKLRDANTDLVAKYNQAIQELIRLKGQEKTADEKAE
jgi:hypothetical protein